MALEPAIIPVELSGSLDQKRDYKTQLPGSLLLIQNAVRRKGSRWDKRYGFSSINHSTALASGSYLATYRDQLIAFDGPAGTNGVFSYSKTADRLDRVGTATAIGFDTTVIAAQGGTCAQPDIAYTNGYYGMAWTDYANAHTNYSLFDAASGTVIFSTGTTQNTTYNPKVVAVGTYLCFFTYDVTAGGLLAYYVNTATGSNLQGPVTISANLDNLGGTQIWGDVSSYDATACAYAFNNGNDGITVGYFIPSLAQIGNGGNGYAAPVSINSATRIGTKAFGMCVGLQGRIFIGYFDSATSTNVRVTGFSANLATSTTSTVETVANTRNICLIETNTVGSTNVIQVFYEVGAPATIGDAIKQQIHTGVIHWSGSGAFSVVTGNGTLTGFGLASKPILVNGVPYIIVASDSFLQPSYFVMSMSVPIVGILASVPVFLGRFAPNEGGGLTKNQNTMDASSSWGSWLCPGLANWCLGYGGKYSVPLLRRTSVSASSSSVLKFISHAVYRYDFDLTTPAIVARDANNHLNVAYGGMVGSLDGSLVSENNFWMFPEGVTATAAGGGGTLTGGVYAVRCIYEYTDALGDIVRSAPSAPVSATAAASGHITVTAPPLFCTLKAPFNEANVRLVIYGTQHDETSLYYRLGYVTGYSTATSYSALTFTFDTEPSGYEELLYDTGGLVDNVAPLPASCMHVHKGRMWLGGLEDSQLAFSEVFSSGKQIAFHDEFTVPIEQNGGKVRAIGSLDQYLIIFKQARIYYTTGEGPNTANQNSDYNVPQRLPFDVGTLYPNAVVETPKGLIFKSDKGWFLLNRGLEATYIGNPVEDFNSLTPTSATIIKDQNEVRFTHADGSCLVYNYYFNQWSEFTNYTAVGSAVTTDGTFYHLKSNGKVNAEVVGQYNDNGSQMDLAMETSWLALAKIMGYQRLYAFEILADYLSRHHLTISIAYDYETTYNQVISFDTTVYTGDPILELTVAPALQKCGAIKIRIEATDDIVAGGGACLRPNAITLQVGRKRGLRRLAPTKTT